MRAIPIHNPSKYGKSFCSPKKAAYYLSLGRAVMRPEGTLQFTSSAQEAFNRRLDAEALAFDAAVAAGRVDGGVDERGDPSFTVFWNGNFPGAAYPPGCNVQIKRIPWRKSRYCHDLHT